MAAGLGNSAAGVLTQLSEVSNSSRDEQDNEVNNTISIISSILTRLMSMSEAQDGDSSNAMSIDSTSKKYTNVVIPVLINTSKFYTCTVASLIL